MYVALAAACCARAGAMSRRGRLDQRLLWGVAGTALLLALAESFGLGQRLAQAGRDAAHTEGWYNDRRPLQAATIVGTALAWAAVGAGVAYATRRASLVVRGVVLMTCALMAYVTVRAISLHQVDATLYHRIAGRLTVGTAGEIALVTIMVIWVLFAPPLTWAAKATDRLD
jgi:hypothetical protein